MQHTIHIPRINPTVIASAKYQVLKIHEIMKTAHTNKISIKPNNTFHQAGKAADLIHAIKSRCLSHKNFTVLISLSLIKTN